MPDHTLILLIGMPATGKTYWGLQIAKKYDLAFTDLDEYVTQQERASISALFAQYGEKGFRERENKALIKLLAAITEDTVIACGGGTPCFLDNMELMKAAGAVIYLQSDLGVLQDRIEDQPDLRPLLKNRGDLAIYLHDLLKKRKPFYEQAHHILHTQDISLATFDKIISTCIKGH